jgi:hypothetical protein
MRASSLSNKEVIELLSKHFVPVLVAKDESRDIKHTEADKAELLRISRECQKRKLTAGTVCVYIIHPDGAVLGTLLVQKASKPENLVPFLKEIVEKEKPPARDAEPVRASAARKPIEPKGDGTVRLHVITRFEGGRKNYGLSEDWIELTPEEWTAFLPASAAKPGTSWNVSEKVTEKLFRCFYPPGPNWDMRQSKVLKSELTATLSADSSKEAEVSLRGSVELSYPFAGKGTDGKVTAKLVGLVRGSPKEKTITSFTIVSEEAQHVWHWQEKPLAERMAIAVELER